MAADVLHSVYVSILDGRIVFRGESKLRTWLFGVIRNVARDTRRGRWWSRVVRLDFDSLIGKSVEADQILVEYQETDTVVQQALKQLPDRQREIIHLVFFEKLTVAGAAEVMNITIGTASQHYARAKSTLKQQLEPHWNSRSENKG